MQSNRNVDDVMNQFYKCPKCSKEISVTNKFFHKNTCKGNSDQQVVNRQSWNVDNVSDHLQEPNPYIHNAQIAQDVPQRQEPQQSMANAGEYIDDNDFVETQCYHCKEKIIQMFAKDHVCTQEALARANQNDQNNPLVTNVFGQYDNDDLEVNNQQQNSNQQQQQQQQQQRAQQQRQVQQQEKYVCERCSAEFLSIEQFSDHLQAHDLMDNDGEQARVQNRMRNQEQENHDRLVAMNLPNVQPQQQPMMQQQMISSENGQSSYQQNIIYEDPNNPGNMIQVSVSGGRGPNGQQRRRVENRQMFQGNPPPVFDYGDGSAASNQVRDQLNQQQQIQNVQDQLPASQSSQNQNAQYLRQQHQLRRIMEMMMQPPLRRGLRQMDQRMEDQLNDMFIRDSEKPLQRNVLESLPQHVFKKHVNEDNHEEEVKDESQKQCQICLVDYENGDKVLTLPCFHMYHVDCVKQWFDRQDFCPVCRTKIQQDNNNQ